MRPKIGRDNAHAKEFVDQGNQRSHPKVVNEYVVGTLFEKLTVLNRIGQFRVAQWIAHQQMVGIDQPKCRKTDQQQDQEKPVTLHRQGFDSPHTFCQNPCSIVVIHSWTPNIHWAANGRKAAQRNGYTVRIYSRARRPVRKLSGRPNTRTPWQWLVW
jgi:hypothetical protein